MLPKFSLDSKNFTTGIMVSSRQFNLYQVIKDIEDINSLTQQLRTLLVYSQVRL